MLRVWLIARREYVERIRTRGFLLTTVMIPLILAGLIFGSIFLGSKANLDTHIAVVSSDTQLVLDLQEELQQETDNGLTQPSLDSRKPRIMVDAMAVAPDTRSILDQQIDSGDLDGYLWITPAATPGQRPTFSFTAKPGSEGSIKSKLTRALTAVLLREQLSHRGIVASDAETMLQPVEIVAALPPAHQDRESAEVSVGLLFFLMYLVIMLYGMNVARSIIDEKTSRIFEVMLATIRPEAMMAGKILGVGSVGLTQVGIWLSLVAIFSGTSAINVDGNTIHLALTATQVVFFFVYFVLGYLFYSSIAAALGAMTSSEHELQQLNMFLVLPLLFCFITLGNVMVAPDSGFSRMLALIPPFTPLLMYLRVSLGHPAPWEVALSILLTSACIYCIIWITSRIYRIGVLMYGKRPNITEILRWLKYS